MNIRLTQLTKRMLCWETWQTCTNLNQKGPCTEHKGHARAIITVMRTPNTYYRGKRVLSTLACIDTTHKTHRTFHIAAPLMTQIEREQT